MITPIRLTALALTASLTVFGVAACGSDEKESAIDKATKQAQAQEKNPTAVTDPATATTTVKVVKATPGPGEGDIDKKPKIPAQTGSPPKELVAQDLIVGKGAKAKEGDKVSVQYVGVLFDGGKEFDSSWKRKQPFDVTLGAGQVIQGWDQGIVGMREGGRRRLIIPSDLAYGAAGSPPTIPANAALVFDVDMEKITPSG
jgi:peptidylprolyl isomerase